MSRRDKEPRKADELTRRRNLHKDAIDSTVEDAAWLRKHGLILQHRRSIPNDREIHDAEYGLAHKCSIVRYPGGALYVSFKHHKVVRLPGLRP